MRAAFHFGGDMIGLKGETVAFGGRCEKRRQHNARLAAVGSNSDDDAATPAGAKSEADRSAGLCEEPFSRHVSRTQLLATDPF